MKNLGMAVDLGSVGKGAACDAAVRAYEEAGAKAAIIAVGGSVGVYRRKKLRQAVERGGARPER